MRVLLSGIVGSTAYGLATPESDIDRLGVFAVPTVELHGLHTPAETIVTARPDSTYHEARKFCALALTGNPTVSELMWLPSDLYEVESDPGRDLIGIRSAFLSAPAVRDAYLGYASQQFRRLAGKGPDRRTAKHARHLMRLCHQGLHLYRTGELVIRLADPEAFRAFGNRVAGGDLEAARSLIADYEAAFDEAHTVLPDRPDEGVVVSWLRSVRAAYLP
ncbi:MAG TPA: nucleotidyltransferase domain-containing protein [Micromonosporaceae bacterium]